MSNYFLFLPMLFPILCAVVLGLTKFKSTKLMNILIEAVVILNSIFAFAVIFLAEDGVITIYRITDAITLSFKVDSMGSVFLGLVAVLWPMATLYAFEYMRHLVRSKSFMIFYVATYGITAGICFSANLITLYVFYELLTIITLPLVIHFLDQDSIYAGRKYIRFSLGGSAFAFIGIIFLSLYGDINFVAGGNAISNIINENIPLLMFVLTFFGFGVKAAVFPLSGWLPTASVAPTPVTALLHAVAVVNSGIFAIIRLCYYSYDLDFISGTWAHNLVMAFVIFTCVYGSVMAIRQKHFKRRLAYSTVGNLSYILLGIMLLTEAGFAAGIVYLIFHSIIKFTSFLCVGAFMHQSEKEYIYELDGVGYKMPFTFGFFTISALSLTGIPLFSGFIAKWNLLEATIASGSVMSVIGTFGLIVSALLCAVYMLTVVIRAFFPVKGGNLYVSSTVKDPNLLMLIPIGTFAVLDIILGIFPTPIIELAKFIASQAF